MTETCLFILLLGGVVVSIGSLDSHARCYTPNNNVQKLNAIPHFDSLDILFIGNSYCYSGINPVVFDSAKLKTFNLGVASAGVNFYETILSDYLSTCTRPPKSIMLLISPMIFSSKSDEILNNPIHRFLNHPISNESYILGQQHAPASLYPKVAVRSFVRTLTIPYLKITRGDNCAAGHNPMVLTKGFVASPDTNNRTTEAKTVHYFAPLIYDQFPEDRAERLLNLANKLEKLNIQMAFFELPFNKLYSYFNKDYLGAYTNFKERLRHDYPVFDISSPLNNNYFRDQDHLNTPGAAVSTKRLLQAISSDPRFSATLFRVQ